MVADNLSITLLTVKTLNNTKTSVGNALLHGTAVKTATRKQVFALLTYVSDPTVDRSAPASYVIHRV